MAIITRFEKAPGDGRLHPTQVVAKVKTFGDASKSPIVQIDTMGSSEREIPGKLSQTIQLTEDSARQLFEILRETYRF
ncbi:MAG: hypothetical protein JNK84_19125 [Phreatobacter sp.]|uniref:hypothetical protein n=1 Tax=Phreatobacter sp. TaxID=1966341 RepID=UPI001A5F16A5|nr:hypothetical protein [Phreatobacter sp.]MBL8571191.1 hypothetical protein [Phreatobacter sp.]